MKVVTLRHWPFRLDGRTLALSRYQSDWLDWARGLAAVVVLVYHVRYRFFADWSEVAHTVGSRAFYTATAFGHDAVVIFFVLSGLLISRSIFRAQAAGAFRWQGYAVARLSRLYLVLLPGLLLTLAWDRLGLRLFPDHVVYTGASTAWWNDFFDVNARLGLNAFAGNAAFLQMVTVPPYGSNEALWSLSFEFWFYVVFPLLWFALDRDRRAAVRVACGVIGVGLLFVLGSSIAAYFPIWLTGVALWLLPRWAPSRLRLLQLSAAALFALTLLVSHSVLSGLAVVTRDYFTAVTFALLVYTVLMDQRRTAGARFEWGARLVSSQSYTLYVVHLPLLVFCRAWLGDAASQWRPTPVSLMYAAGLTMAALGYAYGISRLTEAHTDACRRWLERRLWPGRTRPGHEAIAPVHVAFEQIEPDASRPPARVGAALVRE